MIMASIFQLYRVAGKVKVVYNYYVADEAFLPEKLNEAVVYYKRYIPNGYSIYLFMKHLIIKHRHLYL